MTIESTLGKYLEFKVFGLFRDRLTDIITEYSREGSKGDLFNHLFLAPSDVSQRRNFEISGVLSPYVCLWRTSLFTWNEMFYGRSVLPRVLHYTDSNNKELACDCFVYDYETTFDLFSSSYYKDFRDAVNQDLLDIDRLRYFDIDVSELLPNCKSLTTRCELQLEGLTSNDKVEKGRAFNLSAKYKFKITIPYCRDGVEFDVEKMNLFLNESKIFTKEYKDGTGSETTQTPQN